ncbi:transketolase [Acidipropionibacterium jensenii]|uniref:transketolase n=1 Tax=Acidipropionibacterium jensenii TaxID=1749 RepID=UPI000BEF1439|nr:transketolase [Acidipropionibacterium jensenii]AZZ41707.1 transketolase [Acidipropionibacterium jensenii]
MRGHHKVAHLEWTETDAKAVDTARVLAADAVEKVGNGHPGTAISLAPLGYLLYHKVLNIDPADEKWLGRDRFVMSAGHSSLTQYTELYLAGLGLELSDLESLRTWGSLTPGHPEYGHTRFIETTTGPLGAGVSNAVGMAMAARRERGLLDPDAPAGTSPFDHYIYAIAGDGCLQEGVSAEASSLAGTQELGNLILFYDDNRITIEGDTKIAFTEDVCARYRAYGWDVRTVDFTHGGTHYSEDVDALAEAIEAAKAVTDKPSFIKVTTVIGWPLPHLQGKESVHGSKLGATEISALKKVLGFEDTPFAIDEDLVATTRKAFAERNGATRVAWDAAFAAWQQANPERAALLARISARRLPVNLSLPVFEPGSMSTRKASGEVLSALGPQLPELWGGSADLAGSNNTTMKGADSFLPANRVVDEYPGGPYGRTLHFGIREHAMGGIVNGITVSGLTRVYGGTFFVFSDYMRPAVRLAALMRIPSIFVWTHDSVGVGEDGPTHQPIEHLAACRAIPGLDVVRPADANETAVAWRTILEHTDRPAGLVLSRQNLPTIDRSRYASAEGVAKGGYVVSEASADPQLILIATGSEVGVALDAQKTLEQAGTPTRVVSMPCQEWFDAQDETYRESVLPSAVTARVSVEAGIAMGWAKYVGCAGQSVSIEHFGASAAGSKCFEEFGITADHVVEVAGAVLAK